MVSYVLEDPLNRKHGKVRIKFISYMADRHHGVHNGWLSVYHVKQISLENLGSITMTS